MKIQKSKQIDGMLSNFDTSGIGLYMGIFENSAIADGVIEFLFEQLETETIMSYYVFSEIENFKQ